RDAGNEHMQLYLAGRRPGKSIAGQSLERPLGSAKIEVRSAGGLKPMPEQSWIITTAVGTGEKGYAGDGGPAAQALLNGPFDVGFDAHGNLYFSDTFNHCVRRVDARSNIITTCAGCGEAGYSGDGGPATRARFNEPYGIAVDRAGNIYVADRHNHCVRRVDAASGTVTTFAGNGSAGFSGDDGAASRRAAGSLRPSPETGRGPTAATADRRLRRHSTRQRRWRSTATAIC